LTSRQDKETFEKVLETFDEVAEIEKVLRVFEEGNVDAYPPGVMMMWDSLKQRKIDLELERTTDESPSGG
jgi:hypothetical protein